MDVKTMLFSCFLVRSLFVMSSAAQNCSTYKFTGNREYATCVDLPYLHAFLHWTYHPSNHTADIAYRHAGVDTGTWVAWALNPRGTGMVGAQSIVALHNSSSGQLHVYTSSVEGYGTTLTESALSFQVPSLSAQYTGGDMIIHATLVLPSNRTGFNQVWQQGPVVLGAIPGRHSLSGDSMKSSGTVDFITGQTRTSSSAGGSSPLRWSHGVVNAVGWGILMPLGALTARHLKVFKSADPAWFYLHVACQCSAYVFGSAGWVTGLFLGSHSRGIVHGRHRNIGMALFCLATVQVLVGALFRPTKDHKNRIYWNLFHWTVGYLTIILSVINIFLGLDMLDAGKKLKWAYIGLLVFFVLVAALLEVCTWCLIKKKKKLAESEKLPDHREVV